MAAAAACGGAGAGDPTAYLAGSPGALSTQSSRCLKPGGTLVYSTCTFAPEENEAILDGTLRELSDAVQLEPITWPLPNVMPGLPRWEGHAFQPSLHLARRVLPTSTMEGFFLVKVTKRGSG